MIIETVDDLAEQVADWLGVFGCCKMKGRDCEDENDHCCRTGFMMVFPDRIRQAVENEKKLELTGLKPEIIK